MKKYLMTGVAALAMCAAFTSCSHEITSQEELQAYEAEKIVKDYEAAFIATFGQPAANQDWGFNAISTRTRAHDEDGRIDVNGNEWKTKPTVTDAEARAVFDYVNMVKTSIPHYSETAPDNLSTYYCTQVWGGKNTVEEGVSDERTYPNYDQKLRGEKGNVYGPSKMNELAIAMSLNKGSIGINDDGTLKGDWSHINNFNAAENTNFGGNTGVIGGGTLDFAYKSSEDSKYHNKWIIIDGQYITDAEGVNHAGKYYVCFDFISCKNNVYTNFQKPGTGNVEVPGAYTTVDEAIAAKAKDRNGNPVESSWSIGNVVGGNMCIPANEIYTDWIIRLVNAQDDDEGKEVLRVFAEDLSAKASEKVSEIDGNSPSDWDFNDVVFDAEYVNATQAKITLWAAGGTLPLQINSFEGTLGEGGCEVHAKLGVNDTKTMINTHADNVPGYSWVDNKPKQVFTITIPQSVIDEHGGNNFDSDTYKNNFPLAVRDLIRIEVKKGNNWYELKAEKGKPACKIATTAKKVKWLKEKVDIRRGYETFKRYVGYPSVEWWTPANEAVLYNKDGNSVECKICQ